jgi:oxidase EvaA
MHRKAATVNKGIAKCHGSLPLGFDRDTLCELHASQISDTPYNNDGTVDAWIEQHLVAPLLHADVLPLTNLGKWGIDPHTGNIQHESGMFFTITGIDVRHRTLNSVLNWDQPIIDQPEIGILGILAMKINGILHFCLQAKEEPGNINSVQLSPTVQATYSNYTRVHGGNSPPFLEYFLSPSRDRILFAKLQTEDGGRFLYKSNRNMIILADDDDLLLPANFIWLTLRQINRLINRDNLIHACTRSILAALLPATSTKISPASANSASLAEIVQWLDDQKAANHMRVKREGLNTLQEWGLDQSGYFSHRQRRFFRVIGINVTSEGREISTWTQPILVNPESGIIGLLTRRHAGERQFLMQAKVEVGNRTVVQLGPTVQFTPANYIGNPKLAKPFMFDEFSYPTHLAVIFQSYQSEEGARFFKEAHLHRILEFPANETLPLPADFRWIRETDLRVMLHLGEQVNSCARSIISCVLGGDFV